MAERILVPQINVNDSEVRVVAWLKADGERVAVGEPLCEVETTKAVSEVEAAAEGHVFHLRGPGETAKVNALLGWILPADDPAEAERLREAARQQATSDVTVSAKARAAMDANGLTLADFEGLAVIREQDVLTRLQTLKAEEEDDPRVESLAVDPDAILIYGTGSQGVTVLDALASAGLKAAAFIDYAPRQAELSGLPVLHARHLPRLLERGLRRLHICLPDHRQDTEIAAQIRAEGFELVTVAHPTASVSPFAVIGEGCFFGAQTIVGPEASLGDRVRVLNAASVAHHCRIGSGSRVSDGARLAGTVTLGTDCLIGLNATVNLKLSLGDRVTVVSGASVYENVPSDHVVRADGKAHPLRGG